MKTNGGQLVRQLAEEGFEAWPGERLPGLRAQLEDFAVSTGESAYLFLAEAVESVWSVYDQDEQGIRLAILQCIDRVLRHHLPPGRAAETPISPEVARRLRDAIRAELESQSSR